MSDRPAPDTVAPHAHLDRYYSGGESGRRAFVRDIFDTTAGDYDRVERLMALGSGSWYRRRALERWGVRPGARVLDVAIGTGLVAREALRLTGDQGLVVGVDPSAGMLRQARHALSLPALLGFGEQLPARSGSFDFVTMGYALRHLSDLVVTFSEFARVVRPGGRVVVLEITPPASGLGRSLLRAYVRMVVPALSRLTGIRRETALLWQYFWDTMAACVPPPTVLTALERAGLVDCQRYVELGIFSEYTGVKPG